MCIALVDYLPTAATALCLESNVHWAVSKIKFALTVPRFATADDVKKNQPGLALFGILQVSFCSCQSPAREVLKGRRRHSLETNYSSGFQSWWTFSPAFNRPC